MKDELILRENAFLQDFFDFSDDILIRLNLNFLIEDCNIAFCRLEKKSRTRLLEQDFKDFLDHENSEKLENLVALKKGTTPCIIKIKDGSKKEIKFDVLYLY